MPCVGKQSPCLAPLLLFLLLVIAKDAFCNFWLRREAAPRGPQQRAATSLQDAIDSLPDGSALELPPGQYQNTKPILIQRNITLLGSSGTRTQLSGSFVFEVGAEKAVLQDVDVVNEGRFVAVHLRCAGQPRVQGCRVQSRGIGILADPPLNTDSAPCVVDCRIGPAWQGLVIAGRCKGVFKSCVISDCRSAGIRLRNDAKPVLRSNLIIGCGGPGLVTWNRASPTMEDNTFIDNSNAPVADADE